MATPHFTFRLPRKEARNLRLVARIYGSASASAFVRELLRAILSEDLVAAATFLQELGRKLYSQGELGLFPTTEPNGRSAAIQGIKPPRRGGKTPKP